MNNSEFRIEIDSLGEVKVPLNALYGAQTQRAVENFPVSGKQPWKAFIWSVATIKLAAARVNASLGLLDQCISLSIIQAAAEVINGKWDDEFIVDPFQAGAGTSHNMNANEVIANRATQLLGGKPGEYIVHPNNHVNMSQSTNDVIPTAIRLGCLWRLDEMVSSINQLSSLLGEKSFEFDTVIKSGRTHLQDAVPLRLGQEFGAYALAVKRDADRILRSAEGLRRLGIGGTAVGTGLNAHPSYHEMMVNELQSLTSIRLEKSSDLFESMQSMADAVDFSSAIRTLSLTLSRIANDLRLLSSGPTTGLDEIRLPAVQPGSSIMPGKINPVHAEMINMAMYYIQGLDHTIAVASQAGQLELNVMMPIIAHNLFEMMQIIIGSVTVFSSKCVAGISANPEKASAWLSHNAIIITALNPIIGYSSGASLVREAHTLGVTIKQLACEKARNRLLKHPETGRPISEDEVEKALSDLRKLTEGGLIDSKGGV